MRNFLATCNSTKQQLNLFPLFLYLYKILYLYWYYIFIYIIFVLLFIFSSSLIKVVKLNFNDFQTVLSLNCFNKLNQFVYRLWPINVTWPRLLAFRRLSMYVNMSMLHGFLCSVSGLFVLLFAARLLAAVATALIPTTSPLDKHTHARTNTHTHIKSILSVFVTISFKGY